MKKIILAFGILLISVFLVSANGSHQSEIEEGRKLAESKISCDKLSDEQLEAIGDYYMEEMHPGKSHELMHEMMGGHDSDLTKNMHVNMAKSIYCGETNQSMMGMMGSGGMMNMMGGGMMGSYPASYVYSNYGYWNIFWILLFAAVIFLIVWIVYRLGIKKTASEIPLNILKKRFAKGEITKKEFDDMKKELNR